MTIGTIQQHRGPNYLANSRRPALPPKERGEQRTVREVNHRTICGRQIRGGMHFTVLIRTVPQGQIC